MDNHGPIVQPDSQDSRLSRVPVQTAHSTIGCVQILRVTGVLQGIAADDPSGLSHEVIRAKAHGKQILVFRIPSDASYLLPFCLLRCETPQWQQSTITVTIVIRSIFPVLEVCVNFILCIEVHHALHDLDRQLHTVGIQRIAVVFLLLVLTQLPLLGFATLLGSVNVGHVRVKNAPLSDRITELGGRRGLRGNTTFTRHGFEGLASTLAEIKLIPECVRCGNLIVLLRRLNVNVHLLRLLALRCLLLLALQDLFLLYSLRRILQQDCTIQREMEHSVINLVIPFPRFLLERKLGDVVRSLWIVGVQNSWWHLLVQFLLL
mmetsp:Transcript_8204/g.19636  ORF Transcript_8204/g.19636 Transcript_8204/m.19636 type:complete len:319 (-) Transcript_8204:162-1118(-)